MSVTSLVINKVRLNRVKIAKKGVILKKISKNPLNFVVTPPPPSSLPNVRQWCRYDSLEGGGRKLVIISYIARRRVITANFTCIFGAEGGGAYAPLPLSTPLIALTPIFLYPEAISAHFAEYSNLDNRRSAWIWLVSRTKLFVCLYILSKLVHAWSRYQIIQWKLISNLILMKTDK